MTVGAGGGEHPSLAGHFIRYIALYKPRVTFTIALDESGQRRALAEANHSAAWEVSRRITVTP